MNTKLKSFFVLLSVMLGGVSSAWADNVYRLFLNGSAEQSPAGNYFTVTGSYNQKFTSATFDGVSFTQGLKLEANTGSIKFTTSNTATVTIVQSSYNYDKNNVTYSENTKTFKFGTEEHAEEQAITSASYSGSDTDGDRYRCYTLTNVSPGTYVISRGSGENGIFYVKVVESGKPAPALGFASGTDVSVQIPAGASSTTYSNLLTTNPENATVTWSVQSAGTTGATVASDGTVTVTDAGTCVVRAATAETTNYSSSYIDYTLTVTKALLSGPDSYVQTYPYIWDFTASSSGWANSQTQMTSTYSDWEGSGTYYHQNHNYDSYPVGYKIDVIRGLRFSQNYLGLDWGYGHIWFAQGNIVIPDLEAGQTITIVMEGRDNGNENTTLTATNATGDNYTIIKSDTDHKTYTYIVTEDGDVTLNFNHAVSIRSIAVSASTRANVTFDYLTENGKLLNEIDRPEQGNEVTHVFSDNGMVRLTAACASNSYNTLQFSKGKSSMTSVKWEGGAFLALSSDKAVIRKVVFTLGGTKSNASNISVSTGGGTGSADTSTGTYTWTGESSFVKFTASANVDQLASVYVEYVERTPLTRFSPMGSQTTTYTYDPNRPANSYTLITNPVSFAKEDFEVAFTSNREVIAVNSGTDASGFNTSNGQTQFANGVTRGVPGTADVYYRFKGNSTYSGAMAVVTFTITKANQALAFDESSKTVNYVASGTVINNLTHTGDGAVSYKSSDTNVATVASDGTVTIENSGVATITATAKETDHYNAATASYTLTVNGTGGTVVSDLAWDKENFPHPTSINYGDHANIYATTQATEKTVKYRSSDESIATVATISYNHSTLGTVQVCQITPVAKGTVTITAYVEGVENLNPASVVTENITIQGTTFGAQFRSQEGYVTVGKTITPFVKVPNGDWSDFTNVTVSTDDASIATVGAGETSTFGNTAPLNEQNGGVKTEGGLLKAIYPTIYGVAEGITTITLTLVSTKYETTTITYTIHVTNENKNFDWAKLGDGKTTVTEYTLYTGDYMMVPAIAGTANGNWDYSKGTTCETKQAYLYGMRANSPIWNNADFKLGGGYPNYRLTDSNKDLTEGQKTSMTNATDMAYILWASSQKSDEDTLMVYGHKKGVVWLHAFDSQTGAELAPIKITILDKAEKLVSSTASYVSAMSYPYTWDFTTNFAVTATPNYWEPVYKNKELAYYTCGYSTMFNWDYCDQDNDENINEALGNKEANSAENKYFVGANADDGMAGVMPQFYGLTIYSGNSGDTNTKSYESKRDKLRIEAFRQEGLPRLDVVGGIHRIRLPNAATVMPGQENFKLVVKAVPTGEKCTIYKFKNGDHATSGQGTATWKEITGKSIVMFDVDKTEITGDNYIELGVDNVKIYWIAMSTEAKTINPAAGATGNNIEMMATYSYDKAMDYAKSAEVNGVDAYVASGLAWNDQARNLTVTMQKNNTQVPTRTGVVLRAQNKASSKTWTFEGLSNNIDANSQQGTDYITKFTIDGLTCELNKFGIGKVEDCSVTVGDNSYTKCLNLLGKGGSIGHRFFSLSVSGPTTISIDCQPQDASKGNKLFVGYGSAVGGATAITTHTLSSGAATYTCDYTGGSTIIFIYGTEGIGTNGTEADKTGTGGYGIKVYGITTTDKGTSAYMIADAQNEAGYTAPSAPASNYLLSTWATDVDRPTLYRNAGNETGTTSGETHIPFIFSDRYTKTSTGNQHHDAGYFSFWRIKSNQITAGKNMAYIVLDKATYGNAANANGKADDITATMSSSDSRMAIRFVDDDDPFGDLTGISVVESEGVSESAPQQGDGYYYDLRGRRVDTPVRGLYIHNGRKVLVK